jgi:outer membrane protein assembly factor BamB
MARMRWFGSLVAALVVSMLFVPSPASGAAPAAKWPQYHGSPEHRGLNPLERTIGPGSVRSLSLSWIGDGATIGEDLVFRSSPTVVGGFVYFGTDRGQLLAFPDHCPTSSCQPAWRVSLGQAIYNQPAVVNGILYVGTASNLGRLFAFDVAACAAGSCRPLWTARVAVGDSSPTVAGGVVYVGSQFDGLYAFDANGCGQSECQPLWIGNTAGYVINSPAVSNGSVFAGDSASTFYAFDTNGCGAATCDARWTAHLSGPVYDSSPAVAGGVVYTTSFAAQPNSFLYAFDANGCGSAVCEPLWRSTGGHYLNSAPAVAYGRVYLGSGDGTLRVFDAAGCGAPTCSALWFGMAAGPVATMESPPMVANHVVYVGENNNRVYAFPADGCGRGVCNKLWEFITQDPLVNSSPAMVNGTLYVSGTNFGAVPQLYVFELP